MAKVFRIHENGGPSVLRLETDEVGAPGPGEVRLIQHAVGINAVDALVREGLYPMKLPAIPGEPPDLANLAPGCGFRARCAQAGPECERPQTLQQVGDGRQSACWRSVA